jgi:hypothetical protein
MTKAEWLRCTNPTKLLNKVKNRGERKLRLFAVACCRRIEHLFPDDRCRRAVAVAELEADGRAEPDESENARRAAAEAACHFGARADCASHDAYCQIGDYLDRLPEWWERYGALVQDRAAAAEAAAEAGTLDHSHRESTRAAAAVAACDALWLSFGYGANGSWDDAASAVYFSRLPVPDGDPDDDAGEHYASYVQDPQEQVAQRLLIDCIFGNPFRVVTFSPEWRTSTASALARQMYESRDFSALPILADALQDAGCTSAEILNHCRGPGPHVRGCWVVDSVLGKE